jgi:hypothetical protein
MARLQSLVLAASVLASVPASAIPAAAGPAVAIRYSEPARLKNSNITQDVCLAQAEAAIAATGFGRIERTEQTRYGTMREYTAAIRCVIDKAIIVIIVSGPSRQTSDEGAGALSQNFEQAK